MHDLNLSLSVNLLSEGEIEIDVTIVNNLEIQNDPPEIPTIIGPSSGKNGKNYETKSPSDSPMDKKFKIFGLHIPKCAGTTLITSVYKTFTPDIF